VNLRPAGRQGRHPGSRPAVPGLKVGFWQASLNTADRAATARPRTVRRAKKPRRSGV